MKLNQLSRREFLQLGVGALPMLIMPGALAATQHVQAPAPTAVHPDVEITMVAGPGHAAILEGAPTEVWRYRGSLVRGRANALTPGGQNSYPGPVLRLRPGDHFRARITNHLPEATTVHWHGLHVPSEMDGQPRLPIAPGATFTADFIVRDRPGIYWYHPHPHGPDGGRTGYQVYHGLAGLLIIDSPEEDALDLPSGEHDLPLVIQDRRFDSHNQLVYLGQGMQGMRERMMGFLGDRIVVNGKVDHRVEVATRPYRLRLLNGSNSRIYKLAWSDGRPMTVLGVQGGMLARPLKQPYLTLAPAQRYDLWVDFGRNSVGDNLRLVSHEFKAGMMAGMMGGGSKGKPGGMMSGMMGNGMMGTNAGQLSLGSAFDVMAFHVARQEKAALKLPDSLVAPPALALHEAVNRKHPRRFELTMRMMQGLINGRRFEGTRVADDEIVDLDSVEVWEFDNRRMLPHPMHVHGLQFLVLQRRQAGGAMGWSGLEEGYVDEGWRDTVLVMPGEQVRILLPFRDYSGLYLYHCHNLEHEDNGMMRYYRVKA